MSYILFRHRVADYAGWKSAFDGAIDMRKAGGEKSTRVFRTDDDPNNVVVLSEWDNLDNARKFVQSADLRESMRRAGVVEHPDMYFLNEG